MNQRDSISWIAVDWGTSNLRAYIMSSTHQIIAEAQSDKGMGGLAAAQFEAALLDLIASWLPQKGQIPVLACGMVGARQGWKEAPYQTTPCSPLVLNARALTRVQTNETRIEVSILPGISQAQPADVMRGEETQLAGLLSIQSLDSAIVCLPGTHSKWARVKRGEVVNFSTFMTGEMFGLLSNHSILRHQTDTESWNDVAFIRGVQVSLEQPNKLLNTSFSIRAQGLLEGMGQAESRAYLSGLLIGTELAGASSYWQGDKVALIGDPKLSALYASALALMLIETEIFDPKTVTLAGLIEGYQCHLKSVI